MKYTRQAYQMMANQPRISLGGKTTPSGGLVTSSGKFDVAVAFPFTVDGAIFFFFCRARLLQAAGYHEGASKYLRGFDLDEVSSRRIF